MRWRKNKPKTGSVTDTKFAWFPIQVKQRCTYREYAWLEKVSRTREMKNGLVYHRWYSYISKPAKGISLNKE